MKNRWIRTEVPALGVLLAGISAAPADTAIDGNVFPDALLILQYDCGWDVSLK